MYYCQPCKLLFCWNCGSKEKVPQKILGNTYIITGGKEAKQIIELVRKYNHIKGAKRIKGVFIYTSSASKKRNIDENY